MKRVKTNVPRITQELIVRVIEMTEEVVRLRDQQEELLEYLNESWWQRLKTRLGVKR